MIKLGDFGIAKVLRNTAELAKTAIGAFSRSNNNASSCSLCSVCISLLDGLCLLHLAFVLCHSSCCA